MRNTETRILNRVAQGNALRNQDFKDLRTKIGKGQKKSRAREVTDETEGEYLQFYNNQVPVNQALLRAGIGNYTQTSTQINTDARGNNITAAVASVDAALNVAVQAGANAQQRVTYRLMSYAPSVDIPYRNGAAHPIVVGDVVYDLAFVSASENRQFLVNGIKNAAPGTRYVKMCIIGQGGINIAGNGFDPMQPNNNIGSKYTNEAERLVTEMENTHRGRFQRNRTPDAGQAEILFPRGYAFRVERISRKFNHTHVVVSVPVPQPAQPFVHPAQKNIFNGQ